MRVFTAVILAASAAAADATTAPRRVDFACPGGAVLAVEFVTSDPQAPALVHRPGLPVVILPAQPSGSGFRYADDAYELRGKGQEVTWTDRKGKSMTCTARPAADG